LHNRSSASGWTRKTANSALSVFLLLEDKIVQKAVTTILGVVYEPLFHEFSHGFRPEHSQHLAIAEIREKCRNLNINWILSADITGLFDNIDHGLLRDLIRLRVNDGGILRLIGKWLNAGVAEGGEITYPEKGTPQGGLCKALHNPPYAK
jgi:RNA-directed DNA polymerase